MTKDLSYLQAFHPKAIRSARRIIKEGFTVEDLDTYLEHPDAHQKPASEEEEKRRLTKRLEKPCCGEGKVDEELQEYKEKQHKSREAR